jgi:periplasmic divalent cation tolerance protein
MRGSEFVQISTTVGSKKAATAIAMKLLETRLASCVQVVGPVNSRYLWKGKIESAKEWLCFIKAMTKDYRAIESVLKKLHSYEVPEILAVPIVQGNSTYLEWVRAETTRKSRER